MKARVALLALIALAAIAAVVAQPPLAQDAGYHAFADQRALLGIAHFWDTASNLAFALAGLAGLAALRANARADFGGLRSAYAVFFGGATLVAVGSAGYHLAPSNASLVWDRLPMTIAFMAFFTIVIGEHGAPRLAQRLLLPLLAAGIGAVAWWAAAVWTGRPDDLRPYLLVQFLPMLLIPLIALLFPARTGERRWLWLLLACYALAKVCEAFDAEIFAATGQISGHTLKHLVAAAGVSMMAFAVRRRRPAL